MARTVIRDYKVTPAGNVIFNTTSAGMYAGYTMPDVHEWLDFPLENVKVRSKPRGGWRYTTTPEGLAAGVRTKLADMGITHLSHLVTRRKDDAVKKVLRDNLCSDGYGRVCRYLTAFASAFPFLTDPDYIPPASIDVGTVIVPGSELANNIRDLDRESRAVVVTELRKLVNDALPGLVDNAHVKVLEARREALMSQLCEVNSELGLKSPDGLCD